MDKLRGNRRVKAFAAAARAALLLSAAGVASCGPLPAEAPFAYVPTSARPGSLKGPFSGRAVDASTKRPIKKAVVYAVWGYSHGVGVSTPTGFREYLTTTDDDGRYHVPAVGELADAHLERDRVKGATLLVPGRHGSGPGDGRLSSFTLIIYKKGFVAYRSDRLFVSGKPRTDFAQRDNFAQLVRWSPDMSHLKHVRFIGAVGRLENKAMWELQAAQAELEGRADEQRAQKAETLLDASKLLETQDLADLLGVDPTAYTTSRLDSVPQTATTDSRHFRAVGRPETHDLAYRVWKLEKDRREQKYRQLMTTYPNTKPVDQVGDRSFVASSPGISAHVFAAKEPSVIVSVTCGVKLCPKAEDVLKITKLIYDRLSRLDRAEEEEEAPDVDLDEYRKTKKPGFIPRLDQ